MHRRRCASLLAILLLILAWAVVVGGQAPADTSAGTARQPRGASTWVGFTPSHPRPPGHFPGPGSAPGGAPTFAQIARMAGTVFSGTVTKIERGPASGGDAVATVAISFQVEQPLRGVVAGDRVTILQWLGLWSSGQRYVVGQRVLLFLYPPSKLGLTSSVGGSIGQFRFDPTGRILLSDVQMAAFRSDPLLTGRSQIAFKDFAHALNQALGEQAPE